MILVLGSHGNHHLFGRWDEVGGERL
jgi:hypothetical protein